MTKELSRRQMLVGLGVVAAGAAGLPVGLEAQTTITVYKDANCGCCQKWVDHMKANGFAASVTNSTDMPAIKARHKVGSALQSCHTSIVGGYVIEGHVPASDVRTLLTRKPTGIIGLTIPGMPPSAPGMDLTPFQPYTVLSFDAQGKTTVFAQHDKA